MFTIRSKSLIKSFLRHSHTYIDHYDLSTTGISLNEFQQRRQALVNLIRNYIKTQKEDKTSTNFTICLPASSRLFMGPDVAYFPFKQQSDFYYLTGCMQPDALLLLNGNDQTYSTSLFLPPCPMTLIDEYERWFGPTIKNKEQICEIFGIDHVYPMNQLTTWKIPSSSVLFHNSQLIDDASINKKNLVPFFKRFSTSTVCNQLNHFLHSLRSIKSTTEQDLLRHACQLTSSAFIQTIKNCKKRIDNEYLIQARFQYECARLGSTSMAFYPVVAAKGRSNVLHYQKNDQPITKDDLIMLDGGCLYKQYAGDITRLWPMNGRFTSAQQQLYEILLTVQKDLIGYFSSGDKSISRSKLNAVADQYMIKYLREEFILSRSIDERDAKRIVNDLCPTSVSHHLGLDVHDCEAIPFSEPLQSGNVITIEPGLYIPWDCQDVPLMYRGFATRIEDDVLITDQGYEVLTKSCPKEVNDLYKLLDERDRTSIE
ncbi:unnamed protein product [Adineta ricciae]|uniref:Aminopeptidase P N-terminal domain-containing protein n=1 Tax=Adineta ricciae TaxID=249248 RepID=A0A815RCP6_ADIRI|nr:unnamed protein product [Adineta ricciae]CAF1475331.1 unnamed protein product [Adineta ricciae]